MNQAGRTAVVTGASSGIGRATARALAAAGFSLVVGARRRQLLEPLAAELGAVASALDVTEPASVEAFAAGIERADLLVNNAGAALGLEPVAEATEELWRRMWETNVLGVVRLTRRLLPLLEASGDGHIINVGSVSGFENYAGGAGYTSTKHALRAVTQTLRLESLGRPLRVTEIAPGLTETEFSLVRFAGDRQRAAEVYRGVRALAPEDVAQCIAFAASRPSHVNIDEIVVRPRDQATAHALYRRTEKD